MRWQWFKDCFELTLEKLWAILLNSLPLVIVSAALIVYSNELEAYRGEGAPLGLYLRLGVAFILSMLISTAYYVYLFKLVIRPEQVPGSGFLLRFGALEGRLLWVSFLIILAFFLAFAVVAIPLGILASVLGVEAAAGAIGIVVGIGALIYFAPRFALVGPMIVDGEPAPLSGVFRLAKGRGWLIWSVLLLAMVVFVPIGIVLGTIAIMLSVILPAGDGTANLFIQQFLNQLIAVPASAWVTLVICKVYLHLKDKRD